jgi:hypothetical protein
MQREEVVDVVPGRLLLITAELLEETLGPCAHWIEREIYLYKQFQSDYFEHTDWPTAVNSY